MNNFRKNLSKLGSNRAFVAIVSVIIAFAVWLFVEISENEEITVSLNNVPVVYSGLEELTAGSDLIVTDTETKSVSVEITGKRNVINRLNHDNVIVDADLSALRSIGDAVTVPYKILLPSTVPERDVLISGNPDFATITVERLISKEIPVVGGLRGSAAEGFIAEEPSFTPATLRIKGPAGVVNTIERAEAYITRENLSSSVAENVSPVFVSENGSSVSTDDLTIDYSTVRVDVPVLTLKELPLNVALIAGGGAELENAIIKYTPEMILVKGDASILSEINQLQLGTVDLGAINNVATQTFQIKLPDRIQSVSGETKCDVNIRIAGVATASRTAMNFQALNVPDSYGVEFITSSLAVTIRGSGTELSGVTDSEIIVECDLSDVTSTGNTTLGPEDVTVSVMGHPNVGVIKNYQVTVRVFRK
jgi:YbbR domain-containing protein